MIRVVTLTSLTALLLLVLYLPSAHAPERFLQQLRQEHERAGEVWGPAIAGQIMERMLAIEAQGLAASPVPRAASGPSPLQADQAVVREMAQVNQRLFNSPYFRSIDALLALAAYRLAALLEWLPKSMIFAIALLVDALIERAIKAKEFRHHDPEMFALYACLAIVLLCASVLSMVWPWAAPPMLWACIPIGMALLLSRAIAHFHRHP